MKLKDFDSLDKYLGKDEFAYVLTKGLDYDPMTEKRKMLIALIETLPKNMYFRLNCNVTKQGSVQLQSIPKKKPNSIFIKHSVLIPLLERNNLSVDSLLARKDILLKTKTSVGKSRENKRQRLLPKEKRSESWTDKTRKELLRKATRYEDMVYKKLESSFGKRIKRQHLFVINGKTYFADMSIKSKKVIIEVDGGYHNTEEQQQKDDVRDKAFESIGYKTLRIPNEKACDKEFMQYFIETLKDY